MIGILNNQVVGFYFFRDISILTESLNIRKSGGNNTKLETEILGDIQC